jgi:hypothetical protein
MCPTTAPPFRQRSGIGGASLRSVATASVTQRFRDCNNNDFETVIIKRAGLHRSKREASPTPPPATGRRCRWQRKPTVPNYSGTPKIEGSQPRYGKLKRDKRFVSDAESHGRSGGDRALWSRVRFDRLSLLRMRCDGQYFDRAHKSGGRQVRNGRACRRNGGIDVDISRARGVDDGNADGMKIVRAVLSLLLLATCCWRSGCRGLARAQASQMAKMSI